MTAPIIQVEQIRKTYGTLKALDGLSFSVMPGECFALLGPNGAGKSTMMRMIYGVCRRDQTADSQLRVFDLDPNQQEIQIKSQCGIVQQDNNLDEELNVKENLQIYAKFYALSSAAANRRIDELLEFMELTDKKFAPVRALSGGMQRRLVIARALLNQPRLLILDEPTTGLDPQVRHLIWDKVRRLKQDGTTVLLTTHYMEEAFNLADRILILNQGQSVMSGNPKSLLAQHLEAFVLEIIDPADQARIHDLCSGAQVRTERAHGLLQVYADQQDLLVPLTHDLPTGRYYLRQTTLEDLFLKLTGRHLSDEQ